MTALVHADLVVRDLERALGFYVGTLGCTVTDRATLEGAVPAFYSGGAAARMHIALLQVAPGPWGAMLELMAFEPPLAPAGLGAHVSLLVDDLEATLAALARKGVGAASAVMDVELPRAGASRIAFVRDPDGHLVELVAAVEAA